MRFILMKNLEKEYCFTYEFDPALETTLKEYEIISYITKDKLDEILTALNTVEWDKKIVVNEDLTITEVEKYTKAEKDKILTERKLEEQELYKRKMIEVNNRIKELQEIGLGGGTDEIKLRAELEEYRTQYMNAVHEEALEADKALSTPTTLEEE